MNAPLRDNSSPASDTLPTLRLFRLLLWVQWRSLIARVQGLRQRSSLLIFVLVGFVLGYLVLGFLLFKYGLNFVSNFAVVGTLLTQRILFLIFGFFFVMLVFSNLIIGYTTLFKNRETTWFLSLPMLHRNVYRWKFLESLLVSSWALIFLSAPMMAAFGTVNRVPFDFYPKVILIYGPFVVIPAVLGSWMILSLVRVIGQRWFKWLLIGLGVAFISSVLINLKPTNANDIASMQDVISFDRLLAHTRISVNPWLPSAWISQAVLSWSQGLQAQGMFHAGLLISQALFALLLTSEIAGRLFHESWVRAFTNRSAQFQERSEKLRSKRNALPLTERLFRLIPGISGPARTLFLKDLRVFWRDPTQWTQFMIFFGLLVIYVINLRNVAYNFDSPFWGTMINYLNLTACSMTLSTLTTRFVFPQFSLEGRRLWILGLAPQGLDGILWQKFWFSFLSTGAMTVSLTITSSLMLRQPPLSVLFFTCAIATMSATMSALATGLGALFPEMREENPSKIVSGFGGTLCLVLSFLYIVVFIALVALPATLGFTDPPASPERIVTTRWLTLSAAILLSATLIGLPMHLACRKVKNLEF